VKLRTQILLFLFIFAIAPLITFVVMNLPMVMTKMEFLYNTAYLQNLRAEFRDLDEHLASRHEMIRLLAKLPDQAIVLGEDKEADEKTIHTERSHYIQWINSFLGDQFDIIQLVFYGSDGSERFWLDRDLKTGVLRPTTERPDALPEAFLEAREPLQAGQILVSPLSIDPQASSVDPLHYITLRMITPIIDHREGTTLGMIMIRIDVGGIAQRNREVAWVLQNGRFLENLGPWAPKGDAFEQFPGLGEIFEQGKLALWQGNDNRQIMWIPMFQTEQQGTLWIGREVDPSPIELIRNSLTQRMAIFVINLMLLVWLVSIWFARRTSRLGKELIDGVQQVLEEQEVAFNWSGPAELQQLGSNLSQLAEKYGRNTRDLRAHAEELEASNRYKSQFLANVSHELRTPLNSILLLSKMLADKNSGLSAEQSQQARVIHEAGSDLRTLIDNILDLSRLEARRTPIHLEQISLKSLLEDLVELMRPQFDARGLSLQLEIAPDAPTTLYSDPDKIGQIIKNFLANAVKFTEQGGVTLRLEPVESASNHDYEVAIRVIDTGIGISEKQRSHIFDTFKQADGSTSRRYGGTGLGLSISRGLAQLLGGEIELQSEVGSGSSFSLLLPRVITPEVFDGMDQLEVTSQPAPEKILAIPIPTATTKHFKGERLLIIGCNTTTLLSIVPLLEGWGLTVTAAEDLAEAQEAIEEEQLSLVLLDNNILNKEGHDRLDAILEQSTSALPVLLIVEAGQSYDPTHWARVLTKPLDMDTLKAYLIKILKNDTEVNSK
jgi:signal transduction histidine kinase